MDEKDVVGQSKNPEPVEISKWAKKAMWCVGFGYLAPVVWFGVITLTSALYDALWPLLVILNIVLIGGSFISIVSGLIIGVIALIHIALRRGQIQGTRKAVTAIVLSLIYIFLASGIIIPAIARERTISHRMTCGSNLSELGKAFVIYADEHGAYPTADKWCDILLQGKYVTEDIFKCPGNKKARCSYSINPNCEPNSEPNTVLVFESRGGWNSFGGPELFATEYHNNEGSNILYNDGHVMFNIADSNGKLINELNWGEKK